MLDADKTAAVTEVLFDRAIGLEECALGSTLERFAADKYVRETVDMLAAAQAHTKTIHACPSPVPRRRGKPGKRYISIWLPVLLNGGVMPCCGRRIGTGDRVATDPSLVTCPGARV